jgi:hypothetical protein
MSKSLGNVICSSSLKNLIEVMKSGNLALSEIKLVGKNLRKRTFLMESLSVGMML